MKLLPALSLLAILLAGCNRPPPAVVAVGGGLRGTINNAAGQGIPAGPDPEAASQVAKFSLHQLKDGDTVAYTYLMPSGWTNDDSLEWNRDTATPYPLVQLVTTSPDKTHTLANYPYLAGAQQSGPGGTTGSAYESASAALDATIARNPHITDFQVVHEDTQPARSAWPASQGTTKAEVSMKRATFTEDGVRKEGIFTGKLDTITVGLGAMQSNIWGFSLQIMSAPVGQLTTDPVFLREAATFFTSATITPEYNKIANGIAFDAAQQNRKIALEENEQIMKNYWDQQKSMEKGMKDFDEYIRDVGTFGGGNGGPQYTLPVGGHYWIDPQGNIQNSPDPNYDPNQQGGGGNNWSPLNQNPG